MQTKSEKILEILRASKATNINNTNNTNNTNDTNNTNNLTTSIIVPKGNNGVVNEASPSLGFPASQTSSPCSDAVALPKEIHFESGRELPRAWMNVKWDLFNNKNGLKLACNIIKHDGTRQALTAALNSPHDRVWRKVEDRTEEHWQLVQEQYNLWREHLGTTISAFRVSKFILPGKTQATDIVAFLVETVNSYCLRMIYRSTIYDYEIAKDTINQLSVKQLTSNQIATLFIGKRSNGFADLDALGI